MADTLQTAWAELCRAAAQQEIEPTALTSRDPWRPHAEFRDNAGLEPVLSLGWLIYAATTPPMGGR